MGKSIHRKVGYVKGTNPVNIKALFEVLNKTGVQAFLMEDTLYSDDSQELKITVVISKEVNR